jgi:DNA mismatch repair protein MutS2
MSFKTDRDGLLSYPVKIKKKRITGVQVQIPLKQMSLELDLRGKRADEVEVLLDSYLNDAAVSNLKRVRIIHGYGTGTVRSIVRDLASHHPLVKNYEPVPAGEGGDGKNYPLFYSSRHGGVGTHLELIEGHEGL